MKQQKSLEKKFKKEASAGKNGKTKKDKYAHFKGKYAHTPSSDLN